MIRVWRGERLLYYIYLDFIGEIDFSYLRSNNNRTTSFRFDRTRENTKIVRIRCTNQP